ncbi:MAG: tetratricopeptide repeat protein [Candidatus Obscuribacterales bacterium]|nr:tetratricopeptide repeat protein [Candidatus Obscuribacterales bacterium]
MTLPTAKTIILPISLAMTLTSVSAANQFDLNRTEQLIDSGKLDGKQASELIEFVRTHPKNLKAHIILGRYYSIYNLGELAAAQYEQALKIDNKQPSIWLSLANEKYRHRKPSEAMKILNDAEKRFPKSHDIIMGKCNLLLKQNNLPEAIKYLPKAQASDPKDPEVYVAYSRACMLSHKYPEALEQANHALSLKSDYSEAYAAQAQALVALGKDKEALHALISGFKYDSLNKSLNKLLIQEAEKSGSPELAFEAALGIIGVDVNNINELDDDKDKVISLIHAAQKSGATDSSISSSIEKISNELKGTGHQAKYLFCIGDIYDRLKQPQRAMTFYRQGLAIDPSYARAYLRIGEDYELLYQNEKALENYRKAYTLKHSDLEIVSRLTAMEKKVSEEKNNALLKLFNSIHF